MKFEKSDVNFPMKLNWVRRHRHEVLAMSTGRILLRKLRRRTAFMEEKALNHVRIVSQCPNEKEAVYGELNEFPLIAAAKWQGVIKVAKWMLSKGEGATMGTYDTLLLAFDMDKRIDEAESLWNVILHTHTHSISKRLFSRMISLYDHHGTQDRIIEILGMGLLCIIFADMEELHVKPDDDTVRIVAPTFQKFVIKWSIKDMAANGNTYTSRVRGLE